MTNVLLIKGNDRPSTDSVSVKMYETFLQEVQKKEEVAVTIYDVYAENTPFMGQVLFSAFNKIQNGSELSKEEQEILAAKQKAMDLVNAADVLVVAFPMWNLTIPAKLQTFIDYIFAAGYAFKYDEQGNMVPLLTDKKVILLGARGGVYSIPEMQALEMSVNYLSNTFGGIFGMEILDTVIIEGHAAQPSQAEEIIQNGLEKVKESVAKIS